MTPELTARHEQRPIPGPEITSDTHAYRHLKQVEMEIQGAGGGASVAHINHALVKPSEEFAGLCHQQSAKCIQVWYACAHLYLTDCSSRLKCPVCGLRQQPQPGP